MSNDFILNSDIISVFEKNGVVLLKNMMITSGKEYYLMQLRKISKNLVLFFMHTKLKKAKGTSTET